jgi:2-polyprenyl-6-methoxyphenol hydroxylase-like FAD-dependent oxidoreductase
LIIGGSMSGLFAALYLRRRGWDADVFERSPAPLSGRGAGIMTHPEMREALAELGIDSSSNFGVPVERRVVLDRAGDVIAQRAVRRRRPPGTACSRCWAPPSVASTIIWARTCGVERKA